MALGPCSKLPTVAMTDQCSPNGDSFFSVFTNVRCGGSFDFTLVFEQALLGLLPAVVFILAGGFRLVQLSSKKTKTTASTQRALKLVCVRPSIRCSTSTNNIVP